MDLDAKIEERKRKNTPFLKAFEHVRTELDMTQRDLCKALDIKPQRITEWKNGIKPVPEPVKYALVELSVKRNIGQISIDYLDGYTDIMLLANIPDDELAEIKMRRSNPDYDKIKERIKEKERQLDNDISQAMPYIDPSSQQNATIAVYVQYTNYLTGLINKKEIEMQKRLAEKDDIIAQLQQTVEDKITIIKAREAQIVALERQLAANSMSDIKHYPFTIGAAEDENKQNVSP